MRTTTFAAPIFAALTLCAVSAGAQYAPQQRVFTPPPRFTIGGGVEYAQPLSQFRQYVGHGFGGGGFARMNLDRGGLLSLRGDVQFINYGNDTKYFTVGGLLGTTDLQETTSNNIVVATVGPQLTIPLGGPSLYANGGIGVGYFYTSTSLDDPYYDETLASNTNYSDNSVVYAAGTGLTIPISVGRQVVSLDLGARYNAIGRTHYLTKGDIQADPNSRYGVIITPHESEARFMTYRVGVTVGF